MNTGICPKCNGTLFRPCPDNMREYGISHGWYGYRAADDTVPCDNCGAQKMFSSATGVVPLRNDNGMPCLHEYEGQKIGNCLHRYTCKHCGDRYEIDSGD